MYIGTSFMRREFLELLLSSVLSMENSMEFCDCSLQMVHEINQLAPCGINLGIQHH
jgi:hypothetical protein